MNSNGKDQDVLAGQRFVDLRKLEPLGFQFRFRFLNAHLVFELDRNRRIFLAIFEQYQPAARLQRRADPVSRPRSTAIAIQ